MREDPTRRGLLYAGTQHGVYVSFDDGERWESLSLNLPDTPGVRHLVVEANSIAIATHGRGFYILDDIAPLRQSSPQSRRPTDAVSCSSRRTRSAAAGGATITYLLQEAGAEPDARDPRRAAARSCGRSPAARRRTRRRGGRGRGDAARRRLARRQRLSAAAAVGRRQAGRQPAAPRRRRAGRWRSRTRRPPTAPMAAGLNRVTWDLRLSRRDHVPGHDAVGRERPTVRRRCPAAIRCG